MADLGFEYIPVQDDVIKGPDIHFGDKLAVTFDGQVWYGECLGWGRQLNDELATIKTNIYVIDCPHGGGTVYCSFTSDQVWRHLRREELLGRVQVDALGSMLLGVRDDYFRLRNAAKPFAEWLRQSDYGTTNYKFSDDTVLITHTFDDGKLLDITLGDFRTLVRELDGHS